MKLTTRDWVGLVVLLVAGLLILSLTSIPVLGYVLVAGAFGILLGRAISPR